MAQPKAAFPLDKPVPKDMREALAGMARPSFCQSQKYQEQQWRAFREGAHPKIREFEKLLVRRMKALGVPMFAHCMVRSRQEQRRLFVDGFSKNDGSGWYPHLGCAVDVVHGIEGWGLNEAEWRLVGHVGFEVAKAAGIKVTWGGDFKEDGFADRIEWDPAHWELKGWKELVQSYPYQAAIPVARSPSGG